jgi:hypothetical protein
MNAIDTETTSTSQAAAVAAPGTTAAPTKAAATRKATSKKVAPKAASAAAAKAKTTAKSAKAKPAASKKAISKPATKKPAATARPDSKKAQVVALLQRKGGVSITELMERMGWARHTVRGFMAGAMKKAGYTIESFKPEGGERGYRLGK